MNGIKLGDKVIWQEDYKEYIVIGLDENNNNVAINYPEVHWNIKNSIYATQYLKTGLEYFKWVPVDKLSLVPRDDVKNNIYIYRDCERIEEDKNNYIISMIEDGIKTRTLVISDNPISYKEIETVVKLKYRKSDIDINNISIVK